MRNEGRVLFGSIFLLAIGAIAEFAVHPAGEAFRLHPVGLVLMIIGLAGLVSDFVRQRPPRRADGVDTEA